MSQIQVRDIAGRGIPDIRYRISLNDEPSSAAIYDNTTDDAGNSGWPIPFWPQQQDYTLYINDTDVKPAYQEAWGLVPAEHEGNIEIILPRNPLPRLYVQNQVFVNPAGERVFLAGHTDFLLYKRYLDGEDITPLLVERSDYGSNCARVIGMVSSFSHWYPQEYGQRYYDSLPAFCKLLDDYGMYVYFTVFADTEIVMPRKSDQVEHFAKVVGMLQQSPNTLGELVNEPYAHQNATADPFAFPRPIGAPFSSGSYNDHLGAKVTPPPHWDFHDFHTPRKPIKRVADQCMSTNPNYAVGVPVPMTPGEKRRMAVGSGEPDKFGGPNEFNPKIYLTDPEEARQMRITAEGTACMYIYHTSAGVWSLPWNGVEQQCAAATFLH